MPFAFLHLTMFQWTGGHLLCTSLRFLCVKIAEENITQTLALMWDMGREREKSL